MLFHPFNGYAAQPAYDPKLVQDNFAFFGPFLTCPDLSDEKVRPKRIRNWKRFDIAFETTIQENPEDAMVWNYVIRMMASRYSGPAFEIGSVTFTRISQIDGLADLNDFLVDVVGDASDRAGEAAAHVVKYRDRLAEQDFHGSKVMILVDDVRVDPRFRGAGIGLALLQRLQAATAGFPAIVACNVTAADASILSLVAECPSGVSAAAVLSVMRRGEKKLANYLKSGSALGLVHLAPKREPQFLVAEWLGSEYLRFGNPAHVDYAMIIDPDVLTSVERILVGCETPEDIENAEAEIFELHEVLMEGVGLGDLDVEGDALFD